MKKSKIKNKIIKMISTQKINGNKNYRIILYFQGKKAKDRSKTKIMK